MSSEVSSGTGASDHTARWFWAFLGAHVVVWTLLPVLVQPNAPLDIVEMLFFGREWQWGYFKHPPLPSWMAEAAYQAAGGRIWGVYLVAQFSVALCLWCVWRLGRELLPARTALLGAMLLEVSWNYTVSSPEFNNNVGLYPFWTLAILMAHWALGDGRNRFWIGAGLALGLAMLAKYTAAVLAGAMFLYLLADPAARHWWRRPGPYLTILAAVAVFLPHLVWAMDHGFPAIGFALGRTQGESRIWNHVLCPLAFAVSQAFSLLPTALVLGAVVCRPLQLRPLTPDQQAHRRFLLAVVLGPFALCLVLAAAKSLWFRTAYGSQLWPYAGLLALYCLRVDVSRDRWNTALGVWSILVGALLVATIARNAGGPWLQHKPSRVHFNGPALAQRVERAWRSRFDRPLDVAAGEWWLAGNVALYGPSRAHVWGGSDPDIADFGPHYAAWMSDAAFRRSGGVILWNADDEGRALPAPLRHRFPNVEVLEPIVLPYQTAAPLPPVRIGIALVRPADCGK